MEGLLPTSIPEEAEGKKKKKVAQVVEVVPEPVQELRKGPKKKGHVWTPVKDAFSKPSLTSARAKSAGPLPSQRGDASITERMTSGGQDKVAAAQEARLRLMAIAEEKMQAVEREDFELAERLKQEERSLQQIAQGSSWATVAVTSTAKPSDVPRVPVTRGRSLWAQSLAANGLGLRSSSEGPRVASSSAGPGHRRPDPTTPNPTIDASSGAASSAGHGAPRRGGLAFFLTAPGELTADTFKPTTTHVSRRDALARIASAALWRGRGAAWETTKEIAFLFEDNKLMRILPRFVASCPVPSEFQLITVLGRAIERENVLGMQVVKPESKKDFGGHVQRVVGEYAKAGRTAVVLLHESHPLNLGIYTTPADTDEGDGSLKDDEDRTLIFFLGAVKDMTPEETRAVHRACQVFGVPCVEANLGQQAEFTSKIIDVLHGHHLFGRLMPAAWRCARRRCGSSEGIGPAGPQGHKPPRGTFWVLIPMGGGPRELAADDKKKDGMYEIPRSCISQLWCSKGEHKGNIVSFVFAGGEVLTVNATLVTCLKMQHRAAPTERNLVNALKVGIGDQRADPALVIDDGCVGLGDVTDLSSSKLGIKVDRHRTALVDLTLGGDDLAGPRLWPYSVPDADRSLDSSGFQARDIPRDVVVLLHDARGRDFPRGFREKLAATLLGESSDTSRWRRMSFPGMSVNASISLLSYYRQTGTLGPALVSRSPAGEEGRSRSAKATETADEPVLESRQNGGPGQREGHHSGHASGPVPKSVPRIMRRPA